MKMLGVYYPNDQGVLPVLVMELMECNLTQLLENYQNIHMYVKLSILQDVSRAICYLHTLNPPLMHCNLSSKNILLTTSLVAKVCDCGMKRFSLLGIKRPVRDIANLKLATVAAAGNTGGFALVGLACLAVSGGLVVPGSGLAAVRALRLHHYGLPSDMFSFGCVVCHVITQQWPKPLDLLYRGVDPTIDIMSRALSELGRNYIDQISGDH